MKSASATTFFVSAFFHVHRIIFGRCERLMPEFLRQGRQWNPGVVDALIFDLRENHGGDPSMVDFMVSYLFRGPTHINDLTNRHDNETHQYWALPWIPGPRFIDQPVYVLTSHETFSGGKEFTFDLKTQKRATIVGETTGGGAHPVRGMPAGDHFTIGVPFGRPINPVTKGDWEGKGVEPDVKVSAADALTTAEKLAAEKLVTKDSQH
jgi:C-terminal processing protease CtpA/Prc